MAKKLMSLEQKSRLALRELIDEHTASINDEGIKGSYFNLMGVRFNNEIASYYAKFHEPVKVSVDSWIRSLGLKKIFEPDEKIAGRIFISVVGVDKQKILDMSVDALDNPIYIGFMPFYQIGSKNESQESSILFDGNHRLCKAYQLKKKTIKAILFSPLEVLHITGMLDL